MTDRKILAAIGQLPQDVAVLQRAIEVAKTSAAELHIVHVLDLPGNVADLDDSSTMLGQAAIAARDRIKAALNEMGEDPATAKIHIEMGAHALVLIDACKTLSPDLIVMRAHQKKKISERLLGSTTDRVIAAGQIPVLVVKRAVKNPYDRVVLGTNGADDVLQASAFVSGLLPAAKFHLVQVVQIPRQFKEEMLRIGTSAAHLAAHRKKLIDIARDHLRELETAIDRSVTSQVMKGDPAKSLAKLCRKADVDLIVLGQGRTSLISRAFIGSVSRRLLREAVCDVLIWCPRADA